MHRSFLSLGQPKILLFGTKSCTFPRQLRKKLNARVCKKRAGLTKPTDRKSSARAMWGYLQERCNEKNHREADPQSLTHSDTKMYWFHNPPSVLKRQEQPQTTIAHTSWKNTAGFQLRFANTRSPSLSKKRPLKTHMVLWFYCSVGCEPAPSTEWGTGNCYLKEITKAASLASVKHMLVNHLKQTKTHSL